MKVVLWATIIVPLVASLLGCLGYFTDIFWLFWLGAALAFLNALLDTISGMRFPWLRIGAVGIGVFTIEPWYFGAAVGLLIMTAIEALIMVASGRWRDLASSSE